MPLTAMPSSSPVIRNEIEPLRRPLGEIVERRRDGAGDRALHVDRAAAVERVADDLAGERRLRPGGVVAGRHHVGVAGEHEMRRAGADAGVEVLDRRGAGLREGDAVDREARGLAARFRAAPARRPRPVSPRGSAAGRARAGTDRCPAIGQGRTPVNGGVATSASTRASQTRPSERVRTVLVGADGAAQAAEPDQRPDGEDQPQQAQDGPDSANASECGGVEITRCEGKHDVHAGNAKKRMTRTTGPRRTERARPRSG